MVLLSTRVLKPLGMSTQMLHVRANDARLHVIPPVLIRPTSTTCNCKVFLSLSLFAIIYTVTDGTPLCNQVYTWHFLICPWQPLPALKFCLLA